MLELTLKGQGEYVD